MPLAADLTYRILSSSLFVVEPDILKLKEVLKKTGEIVPKPCHSL